MSKRAYGVCVWCELEEKYDIELEDHFCNHKVIKGNVSQ